jgi:hypothetical protein
MRKMCDKTSGGENALRRHAIRVHNWLRKPLPGWAYPVSRC